MVKIDNKIIVMKFFILINFFIFLPLLSAYSEELKTINVSLPTKFGVFLGEIHYSQKDLLPALKVERVIKEDLIKVINYFEYVPEDIVHFNIDPELRLTNGNARTFPTNIINLYNFPSSNMEHLVAMENWWQGLVIHEFVHIVHLDQTRGYLNIGRNIFGTIAKILAAIVPSWFTEGIAVWGESTFINGGRLSNPFFKKELLIALLKSNSCQSIDCLDNPGIYPNHQYAYWVGAHFLEFLEKKKANTIKCLVEYNSSALPFFLNNAFNACVGDSAQAAFAQFKLEFLADKGEPSFLKLEKTEKIKNIFGDDDFQKGWVFDNHKLYKVEANKKNEALVYYDFKNNIQRIGRYDAPISDVFSMIDEGLNKKMLLVSFNDDPHYVAHNKVWKLIDSQTLKIERVLNLPFDPSYVFPIGNSHTNQGFLSFSYWQNRWQVFKDHQTIFSFPSDYNLSKVLKSGDHFLLKINDGKGVSHLVLADKNFEKLATIYRSDKAFNLLVVNKNYVVVKDKEEVKLLEFDQQDLKISVLPNRLFEGVAFLELQKERFLFLEKDLQVGAKLSSDLEKIFLKEKTQTKKEKLVAFEILPELKASLAAKGEENYPRLDHFVPYYWFLTTGNSDKLGSFGAFTSLADPMEVYQLKATLLAYPSVKKFGGNLDYLQEIIPARPWWRANAFLNREYAKTNFSSNLDRFFEFKLRSDYKFLFKKWVYFPGLFVGASTTSDFISNRSTKIWGTSQVIQYHSQRFDQLMQFFDGHLNVQNNQPNIGPSFRSSLLKVQTGMRFFDDLEGTLTSSYSKLFKSDYHRGVVYAGGVSDYSKSRDHAFYGIPYGNAYGNEIFTGRFTFDYDIWDVYRGKGFIPFYLKEIHFLTGPEIMFANRIYFAGNILKDKMINAFFIGPKLKLTLFYFVPTDIDLVYSSTTAPGGKNIRQWQFLITLGLN